MTRITLNVEQLQVDSFETAQRTPESGTAQRGWSDDSICPTTIQSEHRCY